MDERIFQFFNVGANGFVEKYNQNCLPRGNLKPLKNWQGEVKRDVTALCEALKNEVNVCFENHSPDEELACEGELGAFYGILAAMDSVCYNAELDVNKVTNGGFQEVTRILEQH